MIRNDLQKQGIHFFSHRRRNCLLRDDSIELAENRNSFYNVHVFLKLSNIKMYALYVISTDVGKGDLRFQNLRF